MPALRRWNQLQGQYLKRLQVKSMSLQRTNAERRFGAVGLPRAACDVGRRFTWEFENRREAGAEILRVVARVAQGHNCFLGGPRRPAIHFKQRGVTADPV